MKLLATFLAVFVLGCGGKPQSSSPSNTAAGPAAATPAPSPGVYGGAAYGGYTRTPELAAFHDLIATRTPQDACAVKNELQTAAAAIAKAAPPLASDPEGMWSGEANELAGIAEDFVGNCAGADGAMIAADVAALNRSFQRLLLQLPSP